MPWLLEPAAGARPPRVADVGAGTGKLTRVAIALGAMVSAIDPNAAMLDALRAAVPGVPTAVGTAEELPLPDMARSRSFVITAPEDERARIEAGLAGLHP